MYIEIWILSELFPSQPKPSGFWKNYPVSCGCMQVAGVAMNSDLIDCKLSGLQTGNGRSGVCRGTAGSKTVLKLESPGIVLRLFRPVNNRDNNSNKPHLELFRA